jgi:O-antigen/teichoic acid export membrane protein
MGVIRKQSIQTAMMSYFGFGLGYINAVLLYPAFFEPEEFGLTRVLIAVIGISGQLALFGMTNAIIRFFPRFKEGDEDNQQGLLFYALQCGLAGVVAVWILLYLGQNWVLEYKGSDSELFSKYYYLLFPFLAFEVLYQITASYTRALYHSVVNVFFKEVFLRMTTTVLIFAYYLEWLDFENFMFCFVLQQSLLGLGMLAFLKKIGKLGLKKNSSFYTKELTSEIWKYRSFTAMTNLSAHFLMAIDVLMIGMLIDLGNTAFYAVAFYIVALINIPRNAMANISLPVISDAWKRDDLKEIQQVYSKTSINALVIGTLIFIGIWANQANIFTILPAEYAGGKWVLLFVGIARLADIGFGLNGGIISTSKWYKFDTYANFALLLLTVILNLIFIPKYGLTGAAMATAIALISFNILKFSFLKIKFDLNPFGIPSLLTVLLGAAVYGVSTLVPVQEHFVLDIIVRSGLITVLFVPAAYVLQLSKDANEIAKLWWNKVFGKS